MDTGQTPAKTAPKLFSRQATGLVRAVPQRAALIFNFIPSHPAFVLSAGVFFASGCLAWWRRLSSSTTSSAGSYEHAEGSNLNSSTLRFHPSSAMAPARQEGAS